MNLILFRYILKQFALIFFATLFVLTAIVLLFDTIELLRNAAKRENIAFIDVGILALLKSPQMIHIILPFVTLIAGIIFFFKYSNSSELIVMRAVGLSVWNFILPILMFTLIIGVFDVTVFNPVASLTAKQFERLEERIGMSRSHPFSWSEDGLWLRETKDDKTIVVRASRVRQKDNEVLLDKVSVFELTKEDTFLQQMEANVGVLGDGKLILKNAFVIDPVKEDSYTKAQAIVETDFNLERILERFDEPRTMSFWRFPKFIRFLKDSGFSSINHEMYFNGLIAYPAFLLAMIFIAAVFALPPTTRQGKFLIRLILAILSGFLLYFLSQVTNVLGLSQSLPLFLAAWGPSLIVIPLCVSALLHLEDG